jgi:hypothetical protein
VKKICVYTCITGEYDSLKDINYKDTDYDYLCFTNNKKIKSDSWKVVYINEDLDNLTLARKIKILGHEILKKYDITIWLDGAIELNKPLSTFIADCCNLKEYDMVGFNHRFRNCIYDEMDEVVYRFKEKAENVDKLYNFYKSENYPKNNGLIESTVLVRKNNNDINKLMKLWFEILHKYSRRDQLSFNYCLWKNPVRIQMLDMNVYDNEYFSHRGHSEVKHSMNYRLYFKGINDPLHLYKNIYEGTYYIDNEYYIIDVKVPIDCEKIECVVSPNDYVIMYEIEDKYKYDIDCLKISDFEFFYKNHNIIFNKKFKKDSNFNIKFKMCPLNEESILDILNQNYNYWLNKYNNDKDELNAKIKSISNELNDTTSKLTDANNRINAITNSRSYKLFNKYKSIKNKIKNKK